MRFGRGLVLLGLLTGTWAQAATHNILVTGFWPPTNAMVQEFSQDTRLNPNGWQGGNWHGSGYDIYSYFPTFASATDQVGTGDFPVDFASAYNDFFRVTSALNPIAIVSFGEEDGVSWVVEENFPAYFQDMFNGTIPSQIGVTATYPVPDSLKTDTTFHATLPLQEIADAVTALGIPANVDTDGDAGNFLCGFMGYLGAWYHGQHAAQTDPNYNAMSGFIHTDIDVASGVRAVEASLQQVVLKLPPLAPTPAP